MPCSALRLAAAHDLPTATLADALAASTGVRRISFAAYEDRLGNARPRGRRDTAWPTDRIWYLLYTSGTTGRPKAVIQTVGMALANALNVQQATLLTSADRSINFLPLFHTAGINLHTLPLFIAGGSSSVLAKFEVDPLLDLIAADRISIFFGVPAVYQALSLNPRFAAADLARVRHWGCGGAPLPASLIHLYLAKGVRVCNGMTRGARSASLGSRREASIAAGLMPSKSKTLPLSSTPSAHPPNPKVAIAPMAPTYSLRRWDEPPMSTSPGGQMSALIPDTAASSIG